MDKEASEILILRPTSVFLSFLASQLPQSHLPSSDTLKVDNTAYIIRKHASDEGTLAEIERFYPKMFRHEISRWLGVNARNEIERSYLDFLCCFRLEFHSHYVLLEPSFECAKNMLLFRPQPKLLHWLQHIAEQEDMVELIEDVTIEQVAENSTVLLRNFVKITEIKPFLLLYYESIFATLMSRISNRKSEWPKINSFRDFNQYFSVEIHTQLHDLRTSQRFSKENSIFRRS